MPIILIVVAIVIEDCAGIVFIKGRSFAPKMVRYFSPLYSLTNNLYLLFSLCVSFNTNHSPLCTGNITAWELNVLAWKFGRQGALVFKLFRTLLSKIARNLRSLE